MRKETPAAARNATPQGSFYVHKGIRNAEQTIKTAEIRRSFVLILVTWSGRPDLNWRPPTPHAGALPGWATPRLCGHYSTPMGVRGKRGIPHPRTIAKSGGLTAEAGDGLRWAEGAGLGSQGHGHPERKPSFQAQGVQRGVDEGGVYLTQSRTAQGVDVLIPTAVLHVVQAVLNPPVVAEPSKQFLCWTLRNSRGVSEGIDKPVVQSGRDFPYIRVGGGQ